MGARGYTLHRGFTFIASLEYAYEDLTISKINFSTAASIVSGVEGARLWKDVVTGKRNSFAVEKTILANSGELTY